MGATFSAMKFNAQIPAGAYFVVIESAAWLATRPRMYGVAWALCIEIFMKQDWLCQGFGHGHRRPGSGLIGSGSPRARS